MKTSQGTGSAEFAWQAGYAGFSVSQSNVIEVTNYVTNQADHHRRLSFQDELRGLFLRHEVEFDERYIWD